MTNASKVIDTLNALIETCKDGEYGFRECADHATAAPLKSMFNDRALECQAAAAELQRAVAQAGAEPGTGGSMKGALHRGWVSLRSAFPGDDNVAMLDEAERGEERALERYRQALAEDLPPNVRLLVQRQLVGVQRNVERVRQLKEQYRAVA